MKKISVLLAALMLSVSAYAQNIITPDYATGFWATYHFTQAADGTTLACVHNYDWRNSSCTDNNGKNAWRSLQNAVPAGKRYVGFSIQSSPSTSYAAVLVIYWKNY